MSSVNKICKRLNTFYQVNVLDEASSEVKQFFKAVITYLMYIQSSKKFPELNTSFNDLLFNYFFPDKNASIYFLKQLSGPYHLTSLTSKEHTKNVYIFGEQHVMENPCDKTIYGRPATLVMVKYLKDVLRETPVFLDIFIEDNWSYSSFYNKYDRAELDKNITEQQTLNNIRTSFANCKAQDPNCIWNDVARIHYIDVRGSIQVQKNTEFSDFFTVNHDLLWKRDLTTIIKWCKEMKSKTASTYTTYIQKQFSTGNKYMIKELKRSTQSVAIKKWVNDKLKKHVESQFTFAKFAIGKILDFHIPSPTTAHEKLMKDAKLLPYLRSLKGFVSSQAVIMTDGYALSRIFKTFKNKGKLYAPREPHNIIMYAGAAHTRNYVDFMKNYMGFDIVDEIGDHNYLDGPNCLDMSSIKHPLFSQFKPF